MVTATTTLRPDAQSAAVARRFVADVLLQRGFPDACIADAVLLTSEAVAHVVAHGGSAIAVQVAAEPRMGRVEIHLLEPRGSNGTDAPPPPEGPRLLMLQAISEAWGVDAGAADCCLWFEIRS